MVTLIQDSGSVKNFNSNDGFDREVCGEWLRGLYMYTAADRLRDCGESGRGWVGRCPDGHEVVCSFCCEQRICPRCAGKRSGQMNEKLAPAISELIRKTSADYGLKHIILGTNVNLNDFLEVTGDKKLNVHALNSVKKLAWALRGAVADLFREYSLPGSVGGVEQVPNVLGFGIGIEFGLLAGTLHFHVLALSKYLPQRQISADWARVNEGHGSYVWIEAVGRNEDDTLKAVKYISKYVTKPLNKRAEGALHDETPNVVRMSEWVSQNGLESVLAALSYIFKGVRRFQTYGAFYNLDFPEQEEMCCSACGKALYWISELDSLFGEDAVTQDLLKTFRTNKFSSSPSESPPLQLVLPDFPF